MNFEFEIYLKEGYITIVPYSESETELDPENFNIIIDSFWKFVQKEELNSFVEDFYDSKEPDGHGQISGELSKDEYFSKFSTETIKKDLRKFLIDKNLI
jgi:hypothetical protein